MLPGGRETPQPAPPSPNAFQVAALVVGLMADRTTLGGSPPDRGELLEVQDLVRAGGRLLLGGRRSRDWTRTHHATDAAEAAAEMLEEILHHGGLGKYPDDQLATLQNLLAAAADGVHVLVGAYPHAGEAEGVSATATHPADVIALATGGRETTTRQHAAGGPQAIHVYRAKRKLRQLQPFLTGEMQTMVNIAVMHLQQWTTEHWGDDVELVEDSAPEQPEPQEGAARPSTSTTTADGGPAEAASTERPTTTAAAAEVNAVSGGRRREPRRRFTTPSSLDNDD